MFFNSYDAKSDSSPSVINYQGELIFKSFLGVKIKGINFVFDTLTIPLCSLQFDSLGSEVELDNIQLLNKDSSNLQSCNRIHSINTNLLIKNIILDNLKFLNHRFFVTSIHADKVSINLLLIEFKFNHNLII